MWSRLTQGADDFNDRNANVYTKHDYMNDLDEQIRLKNERIKREKQEQEEFDRLFSPSDTSPSKWLVEGGGRRRQERMKISPNTYDRNEQNSMFADNEMTSDTNPLAMQNKVNNRIDKCRIQGFRNSQTQFQEVRQENGIPNSSMPTSCHQIMPPPAPIRNQILGNTTPPISGDSIYARREYFSNGLRKSHESLKEADSHSNPENTIGISYHESIPDQGLLREYRQLIDELRREREEVRLERERLKWEREQLYYDQERLIHSMKPLDQNFTQQLKSYGVGVNNEVIMPSSGIISYSNTTNGTSPKKYSISEDNFSNQKLSTNDVSKSRDSSIGIPSVSKVGGCDLNEFETPLDGESIFIPLGENIPFCCTTVEKVDHNSRNPKADELELSSFNRKTVENKIDSRKIESRGYYDVDSNMLVESSDMDNTEADTIGCLSIDHNSVQKALLSSPKTNKYLLDCSSHKLKGNDASVPNNIDKKRFEVQQRRFQVNVLSDAEIQAYSKCGEKKLLELKSKNEAD